MIEVDFTQTVDQFVICDLVNNCCADGFINKAVNFKWKIIDLKVFFACILFMQLYHVLQNTVCTVTFICLWSKIEALQTFFNLIQYSVFILKGIKMSWLCKSQAFAHMTFWFIQLVWKGSVKLIMQLEYSTV